ncbi:hypothetical protein J8273_0022 [Carpediemonas membranifera]|uniref:Uncharacterized protein n=1 Tax=Carpediemonas membranifera TaxID=201153 RepID=A0A8J6AXB7_9EUKA|nr:hypothetical protein J8273_0022 [Carpediemonas membranifera]|eukprot:KAG9394820.1 hypothetical protein J8273_0022 [Carpediemonas membranifera]
MTDFDVLIWHLLPFFPTRRARNAFKRLLDNHVKEDQLPNRQRTYRAVFDPTLAPAASADTTTPPASTEDLPIPCSTEHAIANTEEASNATADDSGALPTPDDPEEAEAPAQPEGPEPEEPEEPEPQLNEMVSRVQAAAVSYVSVDVKTELQALVRGKLSQYGHLTTSERSHHALRDLSRDGLVLWFNGR